VCLYIYLYLYIPTIISIYPTRVRGFTINLELLVKVGIASNYAMDGTDKETTVAAAGTNGMEAAPAMAAGSGSCSCTVVEIDVDDEAEAAAAEEEEEEQRHRRRRRRGAERTGRRRRRRSGIIAGVAGESRGLG
jgi:hypothetical protein